MIDARKEPTTLQEAILYFSDAGRCREYLVARRWPDGVTCPRCESSNVKFQPQHNRWQCASHHDLRQFTLKTGTIFEDSPIGLDKWLAAMWQIVNCKNGISSYEIHRALGVTQKTAWFMDHRIRLALSVGGKVLATVVPNRKKAALQAEVRKHVEAGAALCTDAVLSYEGLDSDYAHQVVDHAVQYVDGKVHANGLENFWSLLRRGISGTYVSVEPFHLFRYLDEQTFRYNHREGLNDGQRFDIAVRQVVGKRLTFSQLTGKTNSGAWPN